MLKIKAMFLCLSLFILGSNAVKAPFIDPCKWDDASCILKSSKKALPFLTPGIPPTVPTLDPLVLHDINGDNGELKLKLKNMSVSKLSQCEFIKSERPEKLKYAITLECPIVASGHYTLGGKLLFIDIDGDGDFEIKTEKVRFEITTDLIKSKGKDGEEHYKFGKLNYKYIPLEKFYFKLGNLYGGDKVKAEPIYKILDENWKELVNEMGKPVIQEVIVRVFHVASDFMYSLPAKEIELI